MIRDGLTVNTKDLAFALDLQPHKLRTNICYAIKARDPALIEQTGRARIRITKFGLEFLKYYEDTGEYPKADTQARHLRKIAKLAAKREQLDAEKRKPLFELYSTAFRKNFLETARGGYG